MNHSTTIAHFTAKDIEAIFDGTSVKPGIKSSSSEAKITRQAEDLATEQTEMMAQSDKLG